MFRARIIRGFQLKKKTTRTIEISIKTDEHLVIKQRRNVVRMWCAQCGAETRVARLEELGEHASAVQSKTAGRAVHLIETTEGLLVCLNSLAP